MNADTKTYRYNGTSFQQVLNQIQAGLKIKTNGTELIVTTQNHVFVLNQAYSQIAHITQIPNYNVIFKAATVVNGILYIGTEKDGLFSAALTNPSVFEAMSPNGPVRNYIFRVKKSPNYFIFNNTSKKIQYWKDTWTALGEYRVFVVYYEIKKEET